MLFRSQRRHASPIPLSPLPPSYPSLTSSHSSSEASSSEPLASSGEPPSCWKDGTVGETMALSSSQKETKESLEEQDSRAGGLTCPDETSECAGTHRFDFLSPDHSYPFLVVQFTILPSILSHLPLTYTTPCTINSCPVIYVLWHDLPFFPPNRDLDALELATDEESSIDFIKDFLCQFIQYYYSPLAPFTAPLENEKVSRLYNPDNSDWYVGKEVANQ